MVVRSANVRLKGQMTLPIEVREDLGIEEGGRLLLERRGNEWVLVRPEDLVDQLAGALADYATDEPLQWDRGELWAEIAEERDNRVLQQIHTKSGESVPHRRPQGAEGPALCRPVVSDRHRAGPYEWIPEGITRIPYNGPTDG